MTSNDVPQIKIVLIDSKPIESLLLAGALQQHGFAVSSNADAAPVLGIPEAPEACVMIVSCTRSSGKSDMSGLRSLHISHPQVPKIALIDADDRETVVHAFRSGARGIFCLAEASFPLLCQCIVRVHQGEISANTRHLNYLLDSVSQVPGVRVVDAGGHHLLTYREEQVVALVADGLSNRDVASELGLSEHTVKKYMFRIFDKLGISNRVELVLYAVHHGAPQAVLAASA